MDLEIRNQHDTDLIEQTWIKVTVFSAGRYSLESSTEGFVFPYKGYSDQAIPLLFGTKENTTLNIYNLSPVWTSSSLSIDYLTLTWKLTGGGGFFGSILTTLDSTFGGGRKLFFPT